MSDNAIIATKWWKVEPTTCDYSGFGKRTIYAEIRAGRLRAARVGGRGAIRTCQEWVDEWLTAQATPVLIRRRA